MNRARIAGLGAATAAAVLYLAVPAAGQQAVPPEDPPPVGLEPDAFGGFVPVNEDHLDGVPAGAVRIFRDGNFVQLAAAAVGLPSGMMHMAHIHGFPGGERAATCPTDGGLDANEDGVVDVVELAEMTGPTLIPFHDQPETLEIASRDYPRSYGTRGDWTYRAAVQADRLQVALAETYDISELA